VSKQLGTMNVSESDGDSWVTKTYPVYESMAFIEPPTSPRVVDVFIDWKLFKSTRY
jgi:hypothetical protein